MTEAVTGQLELSKLLLDLNVEGVTHEESLIGPRPGGNCLNWVVGHLVSAYDLLLPAIGGERVWDDERLALYNRGTDPITPERAAPFEELVTDFATAHRRVVERLAALTPEELATPAPYSPISNPEETIGSLLGLVAFHQSYHVGQTGVLRRVAGHPGAAR